MSFLNNSGPSPAAPSTPSPSAFIISINVVNTITHLVLGGAVTCAFVFAIVWSNFSSSFPTSNNTHLSNHVFLCVFGYVIMMAQGVLTFSSHSGWAVSLRYEDKRTIHLAMQVIGALLALVGSILRMNDINVHFQSAHAIMGIVTMIMTIITLADGLFNLFIKSTFLIKLFHVCCGSLTIVFAFISLCLGFDRPIYRFAVGDDIAHLGIALTVIGLVGVISSALITNAKKVMNR